jgi:hypothetical protein
MVGSAVGTAMLIATTNIGVRYTGICLLIMVCHTFELENTVPISCAGQLATGCLLWSQHPDLLGDQCYPFAPSQEG